MPTPMEDDDYDDSGAAPAAAPAASHALVAALDAAAKSVARGDAAAAPETLWGVVPAIGDGGEGGGDEAAIPSFSRMLVNAALDA